MAQRRGSAVQSPLLSIEEVERLLVEGIGALGAWSGGLGGALGGGGAGALGGASGGGAGGRFGARRLTRLDAEERTVSVPRTEVNLQRARVDFFGGNALERTEALSSGGADVVLMVGIVGSGAAAMNPCVVQVVWSAHEVRATAHAKEGLIKQRTCGKALQSFDDVVLPGE